MVSRSRDLSVNALTEEVFYIVEDNSRMVNCVDLNAGKSARVLPCKTLSECEIESISNQRDRLNTCERS